MSEDKNDGPFEAVLHNTGGVDLFIDEFFSFLARRTDFFVVSKPEGGQIGFPPGVAAKLVISKFKKWQEYRNPAIPNSAADLVYEDGVPEVIESVEIASQGTPAEPAKDEMHQANSSEKKDLPVLKPGSTLKEANPSDSYNGRKTDTYSWSQSIKDLDVHVFVGKEVKKSRDVQVKILSDRISVIVPSLQEGSVIADWKLPHTIVKDESYWSLYPGEAVFFSLQKVKELWWDHVFEGEETIDRTKIEAVRPMEELEEEEQAKIQELVYNQERKMNGLPTTEEMKMEEIMKKAWDAEGSPFKGEPFDPSRIQMANNSFPNPNS